MVVFGGAALWHFVVGDIWNLAQQTGHRLLCVVHLLLQLFVRILHLGNAGFDSLCLVALAFLHQTANLCCHLLGFGQVLVQLLLGLTTLFVNCQHLIDCLLGTLEVFLFQPANHAVCFLCNEF